MIMTEIAFFIVSEQIKFGGWKKKKRKEKEYPVFQLVYYRITFIIITVPLMACTILKRHRLLQKLFTTENSFSFTIETYDALPAGPTHIRRKATLEGLLKKRKRERENNIQRKN